jgi:RHS repeat-associated protein
VEYGLIYQDQLRPIAQTQPNGTIRSIFLYGETHAPEGMLRDGKVYRLIGDHLGSVRMVIDADTGDVAQRMDYDAWGKITYDSNPGFQPFGYAGGIYDPDTGLTRFGARDYDAEVGRWTAKDPILCEGGDWNLFAYVEGNPILFIDPEGLRSARPAAPGGNARNRRQWRRHGPGSFERPTGEGNQSAWESGAEMFTPNPDEGDYRLRCLRWECSENTCTPGKSPTDFLPAAYHQDDAPSGCKCTQTNLGPVFNTPSADQNDVLDTIGKYRRSGGQLGRMWRSLR